MKFTQPFIKFFRSFLLCLFAGSILFSSCRTLPLQGVQHNEWYVNSQHQLAIRFTSTEKKISGHYALCDRSLTEALPFRARFDGQHLKLRFTGRGHPGLTGSFTGNNRFFTLESRSQETWKFTNWNADTNVQRVRYQKPLFDKVVVRERIYGSAPGYYASKPIDDARASDYAGILLKVAMGVTENLFRDDINLSLDLYTAEGDIFSQRPLLVLIHGGAFVAGDKRDEFPAELARYYARCGFVVASINYRMGYVFLPGVYSNLERCMYRGVQDVHAALRFLSAHKEDYNIDPNMVFIGGNSAGGFLSLFTAFMNQHEVWPSAGGSFLKMQNDLGRLDASGNKFTAGFRLRGVINMWGAVHDLSIIDKFEKIPVLSIHGTADKIVPCGYDYPFKNLDPRYTSFFVNKVYGTDCIKSRMDSLGLNARVLHLHNAGHEPQCDINNKLNHQFIVIRDSILEFVNREMDNPAILLKGPTVAEHKDIPNAYYLTGGEFKNTTWHCQGGILLSADAKSAKVCWLKNADTRTLSCRGNGVQGQLHQRWLVVNENSKE